MLIPSTDLTILRRLTAHHLVGSDEYRALMDAIEEVLKLRAMAKAVQTTTTDPEDPPADLNALREFGYEYGTEHPWARAALAAARELEKLRAAAALSDKDRICRALDAAERPYTRHGDTATIYIPGRVPERFAPCQSQACTVVEFDDAGALVDIFLAH